MKLWIDSSSEVNNIVILINDSFAVASCDKEDISDAEKKILKGDSPSSVFGDDVYEIALVDIVKIVARNTDMSVDVDYKAEKGEDSKFVDFESLEATEAFLKAIEKQLPKKLKKKQYQQSVLSAGLPSLLSLVTAIGLSLIFINKFRWLTLIIGGLWGLASVYKLLKRVSKPPMVTQWSSRNIASNAWSQIKTIASFAFLAVIVFAVSTRFPNSYGEAAISQHVDHDELEADNVISLLKNGGDINRISEYGTRPLFYALYNEDFELFKILLANGADTSLAEADDSDILDEAVYQNQTKFVAHLLFKYSGDLNLKGRLTNYVGNSITPEMLRLLFNNNFAPSELNDDGNNALQVALESYSEYELVATLLEFKVPKNVQINGLSLKQYALSNEQDDVARLFDEGGVDFEKERELTEKIDAFYAAKIKQKLSELTGVAKLILDSEGMTDDDNKELVQEWSKAMQYTSLSAVGNQRILGAYSQGCEDVGFEKSDSFKSLLTKRSNKVKGHARIAELIVERNRSIYNEAKDEFVTPSEYQTRVQKSLNKVEKQFQNAKAGQQDTTALFKKCQQIYDRLTDNKK